MKIGRQVKLGGLLVAAVVAGVIVTLALGHSQAGTSLAQEANGAMAVDCNYDPADPDDPSTDAGIQTNCTYLPGSSFSIAIHVTAAPTGGYTGFQSKLRWNPGVVSYLPTTDPADEALWSECTVVLRSNNWEVYGLPSVLFGCFPLIFSPLFDTGIVITLQFQCGAAPPDGMSPPNGVGGDESALTLISDEDDVTPVIGGQAGQDGTFFTDPGLQQIDPVLTGATVTCAVPTELPPTDGEPGPDGEVSLTGGETVIEVGEDTVLTFTVVDTDGNTVPGVACNFSILGPAGTDATLSSDSGTTNEFGQVSVTLTAGTTAETVQVEAECGEFGTFVQDVTVSPALPTTGAALEAEGGFSAGLWAMISALLVAAAAGLALFGRRSTRSVTTR